MDQDLLVDQVVHLARFGMLYRLPVVLSTVNVSTGRNQPTIAPLQDVLPGITALDRATINAWKDAGFKQAVRAVGRRPSQADHGRAVDRGLPDLPRARRDARQIPDLPGDRRRRRDITRGASGRLDRIALADGKPTSMVQVGCELQRDWGRPDIAEGFTQILFGGDRPLAGASTEPAGNGVRAGR